MKLKFYTENPKELKDDILEITENGELDTWKIYEERGKKYLIHSGQWSKKGVILLSPVKNEYGESLQVEVIPFEDAEQEVEEFEGYYLGRFCELMFVNFQNNFYLIGKE